MSATWHGSRTLVIPEVIPGRCILLKGEGISGAIFPSFLVYQRNNAESK